MTNGRRLYKDMIRDTRWWNLYLGLDVDHIDVMAYCPIEDHSLFVSTIPLDDSVDGYVTRVEEAIYDNPLLLNEFSKICVVMRTDARAFLPLDVASDDRAADIVSEMTGVADGHLVVNELPLLKLSLCHMVDSALYNFLTRTFGQKVRITHRLASIATYCHGTHRGAGSLCSHVNLRRSSLDIVIYQGDSLLLANTYNITGVTDALYYIVATRQLFDIDRSNAVVLSGDRDMREELSPLLRKYLPTVMPAVFPAAMFRAGGQTAMNAPTDLIVMPLCE